MFQRPQAQLANFPSSVANIFSKGFLVCEKLDKPLKPDQAKKCLTNLLEQTAHAIMGLHGIGLETSWKIDVWMALCEVLDVMQVICMNTPSSLFNIIIVMKLQVHRPRTALGGASHSFAMLLPLPPARGHLSPTQGHGTAARGPPHLCYQGVALCPTWCNIEPYYSFWCLAMPNMHACMSWH